MTSDLKSATLSTQVSMHTLPITASEAMAASKRPRRSHLTSKFNSVTLITYVPMSLWLLNAPTDSILTGGQTGKKQHDEAHKEDPLTVTVLGRQKGVTVAGVSLYHSRFNPIVSNIDQNGLIDK